MIKADLGQVDMVIYSLAAPEGLLQIIKPGLPR